MIPNPTSPGAPRNDYLRKLATVAFGSASTQKLSVQVPQGQYWAPKLIKVSTSPFNVLNDTTDPPACQIYRGGVAGITTSDMYVDGTYNGNGDVSGLISGTVLMPGEEITAIWQGSYTGLGLGPVSNKGTVGVLEIIGTSSNQPPAVPNGLIVPDVIGPHFSGKFMPPPPGTILDFAIDNPGAGLFADIATLTSTTGGWKFNSLQWQWSGASAVTGQVFGDWILSNAAHNTILQLGSDLSGTEARYMDYGGLLVSKQFNGKTIDRLTFQQSPGDATAANTLVLVGRMVLSDYIFTA